MLEFPPERREMLAPVSEQTSCRECTGRSEACDLQRLLIARPAQPNPGCIHQETEMPDFILRLHVPEPPGHPPNTPPTTPPEDEPGREIDLPPHDVPGEVREPRDTPPNEPPEPDPGVPPPPVH